MNTATPDVLIMSSILNYKHNFGPVDSSKRPRRPKNVPVVGRSAEGPRMADSRPLYLTSVSLIDRARGDGLAVFSAVLAG
jgi:hypothetical protein